jgi:hypothetical protein
MKFTLYDYAVRTTVKSKRIMHKLERLPSIRIINNTVYFSSELLKLVEQIDGKKKVKTVSTIKQGELFK